MLRLTWVVVSLCLLGATGWADDADFGDTVTTDIKLTGDISGSGDGLIVGANGITIDLNGYTISSTDGTGVGIKNDGYHGITIKNGTIDGFSQGVLSDGGDDLLVQDLTVDGAFGTGDTTAGIHVLNAEDVVIKECDVTTETFFLGAHSIRLDSVVNALVNDCSIHGGFIGISFFSESELDDPTTGTVKACDVEGCFIGVHMANATDAEVKDCTISDADDAGLGPLAPQGIRVGFTQVDISGVTVKDNTCTNAGIGVLVVSVGQTASDIEVTSNTLSGNNRGILAQVMQDSVIKDNECNDNDIFGMALNDCDDNDIIGNECSDNAVRGLVLVFGSERNLIKDNECNDNTFDGIALFVGANTDNEIKDNTATGNGVWDCFHNAESTPNTWKDNDCDTSSGDDIDS